MRKIMKIAAPALIAAMGLGVAMPAQAATPYHRVDNANWREARGIANQIDQLQQRVNRADRRDGISQREARGLRQDVYQLRRTYNAYSRNGLNHREARVLQRKIDRVKARLRVERHDRNGRDSFPGRDHARRR